MGQDLHSGCFVCGGEKLAPLKGYERHQMTRCKNCGFVFMERIPTVEELNEHYSTYAYSTEQYLSPLTIKSYNTLLDEMEPFRQSGRMLDVGCGSGFFLEQARKRGWEVYGTEYSPRAVEVCEAKGITMKQGPLNPVDFGDLDFDVVTSFEVIEHINNPHEDLDSIQKLLRKGGLFYCTTPNFNSAMRLYLKADYDVIGYPEHLSYYTKRTLNRVVSEHGLKPHKFLSTGISVTRFNRSQGNQEEQDEVLMGENTSDEVLRQKLESKWYLGVAKKLANWLLTVTNTGLTLKGYYIKQ